MRAQTRQTLMTRLLGAAAGLILVGALPAVALAAPTASAPPAPAPGTTGTAPGTATPTPTRPSPSPGPTHPPRTGSVVGTDTTGAEAGVRAGAPTTTATDAPPIPTLPAKESQHAQKTLSDLHKVNVLEITLGRLAQQKAEISAIKDYAQQLITDHQTADQKVMDFAIANNLPLATSAPSMMKEPATTATDTGLRRPATATPGAGAATDTATGTGTPPGAPGSPAPAPGSASGTTGAVAGTSAPAHPTGSVSDQTPMATELDPAGRRTLARLEKLEGTKFEKAFLTEMVRGHQKTLAKIKTAERRAKNPALQSLLGEIRTSVETHLEKARSIQKGGAT